MLKKDIVERDFSVDENGKVLDNFGNEYRNDYGCCEWEEDNCQWCGKRFYLNEVGIEGEEGFCSEYCQLEEYNNS